MARLKIIYSVFVTYDEGDGSLQHICFPNMEVGFFMELGFTPGSDFLF